MRFLLVYMTLLQVSPLCFFFSDLLFLRLENCMSFSLLFFKGAWHSIIQLLFFFFFLFFSSTCFFVCASLIMHCIDFPESRGLVLGEHFPCFVWLKLNQGLHGCHDPSAPCLCGQSADSSMLSFLWFSSVVCLWMKASCGNKQQKS